jgi:hypothetical protein
MQRNDYGSFLVSSKKMVWPVQFMRRLDASWWAGQRCEINTVGGEGKDRVVDWQFGGEFSLLFTDIHIYCPRTRTPSQATVFYFALLLCCKTEYQLLALWNDNIRIQEDQSLQPSILQA